MILEFVVLSIYAVTWSSYCYYLYYHDVIEGYLRM